MNKQATVLVSGNFNVLHPGHLRLFRYAKELGDYLIVAVESDLTAGEEAYVPEKLRLEGVKSNSWVDEVLLFDKPINEVIKQIQPDIVAKGNEYQNDFNLEKEAVDSYGGRLVFGSGEVSFSSLDLLKKEFYQSTTDDILMPVEYMKRHDIQSESLIDIIQSFSSKKVCVIGDLIVDEYITCEALGMSQEDPTIVVTPVDTTCFIGGASIVAAHAAGLGANVALVTVVGNDESSRFPAEQLTKYGVSYDFIVDDSRPTTVKQRYRSKGKTLFRVCHLHQVDISVSLQQSIYDKIQSFIGAIDLLVFSDFNYGCLPQKLVDKILALAVQNNVMVAADSQSSSQIGDISRFANSELLTPTEREARISTRDHQSGLVVLSEHLKSISKANNIIMKLGEEGLLIHPTDQIDGWLTDRIDALNSAPRDVAGAGDSLLISSALSLVAKANIWESAVIGALAAAIQVGRVGNTPIDMNEMVRELS